MCDSFYLILLSHFTVIYFMSCLDITESKAFLIKPAICKVLMIDVTMKEFKCKHAKRLNFHFFTVSVRPKRIKPPETILICVSVTLLGFLLNLNSQQRDFSRTFFSREKPFGSLYC